MANPSRDLGGPLRYRLEQRNGVSWIALTGCVNEASDFTPLTRVPGPVVIDLGDIERINSIGVRNWMYFVRACEAAGLVLTFERCPAIVVNQMSMITNFMGTRPRVKSLLVPYFCSSCNHEHDELLGVASEATIPQTLPCPKCKSQMQLDELPETYTEVLQALEQSAIARE